MDYPGNLGYWHRGAYVLGINADWPAYPGRGARDAIYEFCQFPRGTVFRPIDDIDNCALFIVSGQASHADVWSKDAFHIAVWHSDLNELADEMLIDGLVSPRDIESRKERRDQGRADLHRSLEAQGFTIDDDLGDLYAQRAGERYPISDFYGREERDEVLEEYGDYLNEEHVIFDPESSVRVTSEGWIELERLLQNEPFLSRFDRLQKLADLGMYDSAIRDAGAILETALKEVTGSSRYGLQLVDVFIKKLENDHRHTDASIKRLRTDLRTLIKFVRNEFAHQVVDVPRDRALALLVRFAALTESVKDSALRIPSALFIALPVGWSCLQTRYGCEGPVRVVASEPGHGP